MFAHLHVHSDYSFLDGLVSPEQLAARAVEVGSGALALTDHGEISGHIAFIDATRDAGIMPILGLEAYQAPVSRFEKSPGEHRGHVTLLAKNPQGVKDLWALSSIAYIEGFYYRPRVDWGLLERYGDHLWAGSACLGSFISQAAMRDDHDLALGVADLYRRIFKERFYIELHTNSQPEQVQVNLWLADFAKKHGIPVTFASDVHYCTKDEAEAHDALLGVQYKKKYDDPDRPQSVPDYWLMSEQDVRSALAYLGKETVDAALAHVSTIASSVEPFELDTTLKIPLGYVPQWFKAPEGQKEQDAYIVYLCMEGMKRRFPDGVPDEAEYTERLTRELEFIIKHQLTDYMLTVARYTTWAKERMLVGPGRGSAAGSLVAYYLGITEVDPIPPRLLFERFLNEGRLGSLPDIDLDFGTSTRKQVKAQLIEWYGEDKVVSIGTINRMGAKQAIKDAATYLRVEFADANAISALIDTVPPLEDTNEPRTWEETMALVADQEMLKTEMAKRPRLFALAEKFYLVARQASEHAAGVIISPVPLSGYLPMRLKKDEVTTQFDMRAVERLGFLKADILGLRTLDTLQEAIDLVEQRSGRRIDFYTFKDEYDDQKVWDMLGDGFTVGVFQAETSGITGVLKKMKPTALADLSAAVALYRPGILRAEFTKGRNMLEEYLARRNGEVKVTYPAPGLEPILKDTYGILVYQEQIMHICTDLAGYTPEEADKMRSIVGKKKARAMVKERGKFVPALIANGMQEDVATSLFENIKEFGAYGFNMAHSWSYGIISFWCAWMKANYPVEFIMALMNTDPANIDVYMNEAARLGIQIVRPHVNLSQADFSIVDVDMTGRETPIEYTEPQIVFGLHGVKWLGERAAASIMENAPYFSIEQFMEKNPCAAVNKRNMESLMVLDAFSELPLYGEDVHAAELRHRFEELGKKVKRDGQTFWSIPEELPDGWEEEPPYSIYRMRDNEFEMLGFRFSVAGFEEFIARINSENVKRAAEGQAPLVLDLGKSMADGMYVTYGLLCRVVHIRKHKTKTSGKNMAFVKVATHDGYEFELLLFPQTWDKYRCHFDVGDIVYVSVQKEFDQKFNKDSFIVQSARKGMQ